MANEKKVQPVPTSELAPVSKEAELREMFAPDKGAEVQLVRTWWKPTDNVWLTICLIERSRNVRELFPGGMSDDPAFVWACELLCDLKAGQGLARGKKDVDGSFGDLVFMFEPRPLSAAFARHYEADKPLAICTTGLVAVKSKRFNRTVQSRNWEARNFALTYKTEYESSDIMLPTSVSDVDAKHMLTSGAAD